MMTFFKLTRLSVLTTACLLLCSIAVKAQVKKDTSSYVLTEQQIVQISQLLTYADGAAGNSDKISTRDYNNFHYQVMKIDSVLRVQYNKKHPKVVKKP